MKLKAPTKTLPPRRYYGSREWVIPLECKGDAVSLPQARRRFTAGELRGAAGVEHPLALAVRGMIAERQAGVRPGEPPYRPHLRFEVYPDGLYVYQLAHPLLMGLRLPTTRENVRTDEPTLSDYFRK